MTGQIARIANGVQISLPSEKLSPAKPAARGGSARDFERSCAEATQVETPTSRCEIAAFWTTLRYCHRAELHSSSGQQEKEYDGVRTG